MTRIFDRSVLIQIKHTEGRGNRVRMRAGYCGKGLKQLLIIYTTKILEDKIKLSRASRLI